MATGSQQESSTIEDDHRDAHEDETEDSELGLMLPKPIHLELEDALLKLRWRDLVASRSGDLNLATYNMVALSAKAAYLLRLNKPVEVLTSSPEEQQDFEDAVKEVRAELHGQQLGSICVRTRAAANHTPPTGSVWLIAPCEDTSAHVEGVLLCKAFGVCLDEARVRGDDELAAADIVCQLTRHMELAVGATARDLQQLLDQSNQRALQEAMAAGFCSANLQAIVAAAMAAGNLYQARRMGRWIVLLAYPDWCSPQCSCLLAEWESKVHALQRDMSGMERCLSTEYKARCAIDWSTRCMKREGLETPRVPRQAPLRTGLHAASDKEAAEELKHYRFMRHMGAMSRMHDLVHPGMPNPNQRAVDQLLAHFGAGGWLNMSSREASLQAALDAILDRSVQRVAAWLADHGGRLPRWMRSSEVATDEQRAEQAAYGRMLMFRTRHEQGTLSAEHTRVLDQAARGPAWRAQSTRAAIGLERAKQVVQCFNDTGSCPAPPKSGAFKQLRSQLQAASSQEEQAKLQKALRQLELGAWFKRAKAFARDPDNAQQSAWHITLRPGERQILDEGLGPCWEHHHMWKLLQEAKSFNEWRLLWKPPGVKDHIPGNLHFAEPGKLYEWWYKARSKFHQGALPDVVVQRLNACCPDKPNDWAVASLDLSVQKCEDGLKALVKYSQEHLGGDMPQQKRDQVQSQHYRTLYNFNDRLNTTTEPEVLQPLVDMLNAHWGWPEVWRHRGDGATADGAGATPKMDKDVAQSQPQVNLKKGTCKACTEPCSGRQAFHRICNKCLCSCTTDAIQKHMQVHDTLRMLLVKVSLCSEGQSLITTSSDAGPLIKALTTIVECASEAASHLPVMVLDVQQGGSQGPQCAVRVVSYCYVPPAATPRLQQHAAKAWSIQVHDALEGTQRLMDKTQGQPGWYKHLSTEVAGEMWSEGLRAAYSFSFSPSSLPAAADSSSTSAASSEPPVINLTFEQGVRADAAVQRRKAQVTINQQHIYLGKHEASKAQQLEDAARAYKEWVHNGTKGVPPNTADIPAQFFSKLQDVVERRGQPSSSSAQPQERVGPGSASRKRKRPSEQKEGAAAKKVVIVIDD